MRGPVLRSVLLAAVASLVVSSAALADGRYAFVGRLPWFSGGVSFELFADPTICPFDVQVDVPPTKEYAIFFINQDGSGRYWVEGLTTLRTTNLSTGKSITWNVSGPGGPTFDANGNTIAWVGRGAQVVWGSFLPLQSGGFYVYYGNIDFVTGAFVGNKTDVCAALAS